MENKKQVNGRRDFLRKAGTLFGVGMAMPVFVGSLTSCEKDDNPVVPDELPEGTVVLDLENYYLLNLVGGAITDKFEEYSHKIMIIRNQDNKFLVVDTKCTLEGCVVDLPIDDEADIVCQCCKSVYSKLDASIVAGPATIPLTTFPYEFDAEKNTLTIDFSTDEEQA